jgi:hypothetical protein
MAELIVKLKQHTPIIHFQHYQKGATLRASELKPKLDKFLIAKFKSQVIDYEKWLIGNGKHPALNYKVKIFPIPAPLISYIEKPIIKNEKFEQREGSDGSISTKTKPYPLFFGNLGKNYEKDKTIKKFLFYEEPISIKIISLDYGLLNEIQKNLSEFFALENFGSRQDKGFGSFYIDKNDKNYKDLDINLFDYNFQISVSGNNYDKFKELFYKLELFYKALRSGINLKDRTGDTKLYFKSLLFFYAKHNQIQWEKKTIKENFFKSYLESQLKKYPYADVLNYKSNNKKLIKDLFGLSTNEDWIFYRNSITKVEAKKDEKGKWVKKEEKEDQIERFKSPIFFKIIENGVNGNYNVFIKLCDDIPIRGKWFIIEEKNGKSFPLQIPEDFSIKDFFKFIINKSNFDISTYVESNFQSSDEYIILENIFNQLQS